MEAQDSTPENTQELSHGTQESAQELCIYLVTIVLVYKVTRLGVYLLTVFFGCTMMYVLIIPTTLVCLLFSTTIPTILFNFIFVLVI